MKLFVASFCPRPLLAVGFLLASLVCCAAASPLAGVWHIDRERSTELSPWQSYDLTISVDGDIVTLARQFSAGRRTFADTMTLDTSKAETVVPVSLWPDNRHLGAYIGGDHTKHVAAKWLDERRILRLSTDLVLDTQQGARAVNILSDFKVSTSGSQLTLIELRSTRNRPVVYVFTRETSKTP